MYQLNLILTQQQFDLIAPVVDEIALSTWSQFLEKGPNAGQWDFQALFDTATPDLSMVQDIVPHLPELVPVPNKNWLKECYKNFPPVVIGKFVVYSALDARIPKDKIPLKIEAATAFGTGRHGTTNGCLKAWDELDKDVEGVLDVGCGSGILSIAYAKQTGKPVDAVDLDPESVRVTGVNAAENHVDHLIHAWVSNGYQAVDKKYDLIFCNILAEPVIKMAPDLNQHLAIPSAVHGFLLEQADDVIKAHTDLGLVLAKQYTWDEWGTAVFVKS